MDKRYIYAETLEKKILKYLKKFGISKIVCSDVFYCIPEENKISFTIFRYSADQQLIDFVNQKYDVEIAPWFFIFSLLHEIGHHQTFNQLTQKDLIYENTMREILFPLLNETECNKLHFLLRSEELATDWAIDYLINHEKECWDFQRKCLKIINHIYNKKSFTY